MRYLVIPAIVLCLITGCATTTKQAKPPATPEETQIVKRVAKVLISSRNTVADYPLGRYKFNVLRVDTPNARVEPKRGVLYVTTGLVRMFDDKELALIFLHENAHVKFDHVGKHNTVAMVSGMAWQLGNAFLPGIGIGNSIVTPLVTSKYSRTQELEADRDVVDNAKFVRATPQDYADVLDKLAAYAKAAGGKTDSTGLWDDHPSLEARIRALRVMQAHEIGHSK